MIDFKGEMLNYDEAPYARIITDWLGRPMKDSSIQEVPEIPAVIGTTIGEVRKQNQDRVAIFRFAPDRGSDWAFFLQVLCDGMGGMKNGGDCAGIAIGALAEECMRSNDPDLQNRLRSGVLAANAAVYRTYKGEGGTTIAAILTSRSGSALATVGDSRIYAIESQTKKFLQLSQDDTIGAELRRIRGAAADRDKRDPFLFNLTQFVGVGPELEVRLYPNAELSPYAAVILASDGVQAFVRPILEPILRFAINPLQAVSRTLQLTRWCGGQDNASLLYMPLPISTDLKTFSPWKFGRLDAWDSSGQFSTPVSEPLDHKFGGPEAKTQPSQVSVNREKTDRNRRKVSSKSKRRNTDQEHDNSNSGKRDEGRTPKLQIELSSAEDDPPTAESSAVGSQSEEISNAQPSASDSQSSTNPLCADGRDELVLSSPDDFSIKITRYENQDAKGLLITLANDTLSAIGKNTIRVLSARSFDSRHNDYRDGIGFRAFARTEVDLIQPSESGNGIWLVRKAPTGAHLLIGNDSEHPIKWPTNDRSAIHKWLLSIDVNAQTIALPNSAEARPLAPIVAKLIMAWNRDQNEFFIDLAPSESSRQA